MEEDNSSGSLYTSFCCSSIVTKNVGPQMESEILNRAYMSSYRRSQWSWGQGVNCSSAQTLGSWFPIPLKAWMFVWVYSVFVLSHVQVAAFRRADPPSKESYRLYKRLRNRKSGQGPTKGCRAIDTCFHILLSSDLFSNVLMPSSNHLLLFRGSVNI
jgi:hypothetical protein